MDQYHGSSNISMNGGLLLGDPIGHSADALGVLNIAFAGLPKYRTCNLYWLFFRSRVTCHLRRTSIFQLFKTQRKERKGKEKKRTLRRTTRSHPPSSSPYP